MMIQFKDEDVLMKSIRICNEKKIKTLLLKSYFQFSFNVGNVHHQKTIKFTAILAQEITTRIISTLALATDTLYLKLL